MLAVTTLLPDVPSQHPPIVLVHGAANSAAVWAFWQRELAARGWASYAIDLRGHGASGAVDLSNASMEDYAGDVRGLVRQLTPRPIVMGWSMGGLVALMAATTGDAAACVALAPSSPARTRDASIPLRPCVFGPEEYGITSRGADDQPAMPDLDREERAVALVSLGPESRLARDGRKAGIVIESLPCPLLIVTGAEDRLWPRATYDGLWLPAERIDIAGASHWGLVLNRRALAQAVPAVVGWLDKNAG